MKQVKKNDRLTQFKKGNKIIFEIFEARNGKFYSSENGLGITHDHETFEACLEKTIEKMAYLREEFKKILISM